MTPPPHVKVITVHFVTVLIVHILKSKMHTFEAFRSVAQAHTLILPNMRRNAYDAVFKLYIYICSL